MPLTNHQEESHGKIISVQQGDKKHVSVIFELQIPQNDKDIPRYPNEKEY